MAAKGNVTIYLPLDVLARCRAVAAKENRSLSNYLAGLLERAHPPTGYAQLDAITETIRSYDKKLARSATQRK